jgi:hypothetical protein
MKIMFITHFPQPMLMEVDPLLLAVHQTLRSELAT